MISWYPHIFCTIRIRWEAEIFNRSPTGQLPVTPDGFAREDNESLRSQTSVAHRSAWEIFTKHWATTWQQSWRLVILDWGGIKGFTTIFTQPFCKSQGFWNGFCNFSDNTSWSLLKPAPGKLRTEAMKASVKKPLVSEKAGHPGPEAAMTAVSNFFESRVWWRGLVTERTDLDLLTGLKRHISSKTTKSGFSARWKWAARSWTPCNKSSSAKQLSSVSEVASIGTNHSRPSCS